MPSNQPAADNLELGTPEESPVSGEAPVSPAGVDSSEFCGIALARKRPLAIPPPIPPPIPEAALEPPQALSSSLPNSAEFRAAEREHPNWFAVALLLPVAWWTLRGAFARDFWCFLDYVNLPFHEAGHILFSPFGDTLHILGGTLGQLLVPAILVGYFLIRQYQPFGAALCFWWFGENFVNIARYMADARDLALPLVGGGDHDWNELLYRWNLLTEPDVQRVSTGTHHLGVFIMAAGLIWSGGIVLFGGEGGESAILRVVKRGRVGR